VKCAVEVTIPLMKSVRRAVPSRIFYVFAQLFGAYVKSRDDKSGHSFYPSVITEDRNYIP
jgi:hypothetical protein